jgi:hypothetical protein
VSCSGCRHACNVSLFNEWFFYNRTECVRSQWWKELPVVDDNAGIWGVKGLGKALSNLGICCDVQLIRSIFG